MTVQGKPISLSSGSASYAAIDTGTTLVAGPASGIAAIYAQIPGSSPGTGQWEGFYSYRKPPAPLLQYRESDDRYSMYPRGNCGDIVRWT